MWEGLIPGPHTGLFAYDGSSSSANSSSPNKTTTLNETLKYLNDMEAVSWRFVILF